MDLAKIAEEKIAEAVERGEFENLEGSGKKIDLTAYFNTPAEFRAGYSVLKANRFVPGEVELLREIADLKAALASASDIERPTLSDRLNGKQMELSMMLERNHPGSRRR